MTKEQVTELCKRHEVPEYVYNTMLIMSAQIEDRDLEIKFLKEDLSLIKKQYQEMTDLAKRLENRLYS